MTSRLLCRLSSTKGTRRCGVIMQHLRARGSNADDPEVLFRDVRADKAAGCYREVMLNRPKALNALNLNMIRLILPQMRAASSDSSVAMVVMEGAGDKAFCAGGDIRAVTEAGKAGRSLAQDFFREEYWLNYTICTLPKPHVAIIDGITMGGGVGLSVHGSFRVATEHTVFAMPETFIGLFPDVGGSYFLPRLPGALGMFLALTGYRLKGRDVHHAGIATHFIAREHIPQLREELTKLSPQILNLGLPERLQSVKKILDTLHQESTDIDSKSFSLEPHQKNIDLCFSQKSIEGILKALGEVGSDWGAKQLEILSKMSPTSLRVTHRELVEGKGMRDLADCLVMEYRMSQGCMAGHDFYEGVRAVLVDRDNSPKWDPATLEEVGEDIMMRHFAPLPADREWQPPS